MNPDKTQIKKQKIFWYFSVTLLNNRINYVKWKPLCIINCWNAFKQVKNKVKQVFLNVLIPYFVSKG